MAWLTQISPTDEPILYELLTLIFTPRSISLKALLPAFPILQ